MTELHIIILLVNSYFYFLVVGSSESSPTLSDMDKRPMSLSGTDKPSKQCREESTHEGIN